MTCPRLNFYRVLICLEFKVTSSEGDAGVDTHSSSTRYNPQNEVVNTRIFG